MNDATKNVTVVTHFKQNGELRIICDATRAGLGAALQMHEHDQEWKPTHFPLWFSTKLEGKFFIIELVLLVVVWLAEHFPNCVYGTIFQVVSDHEALSSVLKRDGQKNVQPWLDPVGGPLVALSISHDTCTGKTLGFV